MKSVCVLPRLEGIGGPASFRAKLLAGLAKRGIPVCAEPSDPDCAAVLVVGGTRRVGDLWKARRRGVQIVQRLDGLNWVHRIRRTGIRHYMRSELNNALLALIRDHLADGVVYQSEFIRGWWHKVHGSASASETIIYNAVDLDVYTPDGPERPPEDRVRVMLVEGHLKDGLDAGLDFAVRFAQKLALTRPVELAAAGDIAPAARARWSGLTNPRIEWLGVVGRDQIPALDRGAHLFYSAEMNAPCPNSVIEALACGLPVVAFATGALPELVTGDAGRIVQYGGDPWKLEEPDLAGLSQAAEEVLADPLHFRQQARALAEQRYGLERMVERYIEVLGV